MICILCHYYVIPIISSPYFNQIHLQNYLHTFFYYYLTPLKIFTSTSSIHRTLLKIDSYFKIWKCMFWVVLNWVSDVVYAESVVNHSWSNLYRSTTIIYYKETTFSNKLFLIKFHHKYYKPTTSHHKSYHLSKSANPLIPNHYSPSTCRIQRTYATFTFLLILW